MTNDCADQLIHAHFDGVLTDAGRAELEALLLASGPVRRRFWELAEVHGLAAEAARLAWGEPAKAAPSPDAVPRGFSRRSLSWSAACVLLGLLGVALGTQLARPPQPDTRSEDRATPPVGDHVATVAEGTCRAAGGAVEAGRRVRPGSLTVGPGRVLLNFDGGARLAVAGPAELVVESPGAARLVAGQVAVLAPEEAIGFRLSTPGGTAIDLGTEFLVTVGPGGATECHVLKGEVEWQPPGSTGPGTLLQTGQAKRFADGHTQPLAARPGRFADYAPPAPAEAGELLAYEPFDYSEGVLPAERADGGSGWRSPWRGRFFPNDRIDVDPLIEFEPNRSLTVPGLAPPKGGSLVFGADRLFRVRALPRPIDFGADGVHYVSFLLRATPPTPAAGPQPGPMRLAFASPDTPVPTWVGFSLSTFFRPLILAEGNNTSAGEPLKAGETVLAVCKILTARHGSDQMFMRVYRPGESPEPTETTNWTVAGRPLNLDFTLDHLNLAIPRSEGGRFDELRLGTTWRAVVPVPPARE